MLASCLHPATRIGRGRGSCKVSGATVFHKTARFPAHASHQLCVACHKACALGHRVWFTAPSPLSLPLRQLLNARQPTLSTTPLADHSGLTRFRPMQGRHLSKPSVWVAQCSTRFSWHTCGSQMAPRPIHSETCKATLSVVARLARGSVVRLPPSASVHKSRPL